MGAIHTKCRSNARLDGKTAVVTGSNSGIGKCTAEDFYKRGARVIMACRSLTKAEEAAEDIRRNSANLNDLGEIVIVELNLASMKSIRNCANKLLDEEKEINLLINNAGVMFSPLSRTEDGFETQFGTNHLGHFLLTLLLLPKLVASRPARVVNVSSVGHKLLTGSMKFDDLNWTQRSYSAYQAYYQSKVANILFAKELAIKLNDAGVEGVTTYSLHPGVIDTELFRHFDRTIFYGVTWIVNNIGKYFIKSPKQGAQTTIHCAIDEGAGKETGLYYADCKPATSSSKSNNNEYARKLWDVSLEMVGFPANYDPFANKE